MGGSPCAPPASPRRRIVDGVLDDAVYRTVAADHRFRPAGSDEGQLGHRADVGMDPVRRRDHLHFGALPRQPTRRASSPTRCGATAEQPVPERPPQRGPRHLPRSPQRLRVPGQRAWRHVGHVDHRRARRQRDWNTVWDVAQPPRFEQGWTVEMAIPFRSLRYPGSGPQTWGINFRRIVRWKNELSYLSAGAAPAWARRAILRLSQAATAGRPRRAAGRRSTRHQAVRRRHGDRRPRRRPAVRQRPRRRRRVRREVRLTQQPDRRLHLSTPTSRRSKTTSSR